MALRVGAGARPAAVQQAVVALDAWNELAVPAACPVARPAAGRLDPAPDRPHHGGASEGGQSWPPVDRRRHRDRETRLLAIAHGLLVGNRDWDERT